MNRNEFIESCKNLTEEKMLEIAVMSRNRASGRIPVEVQNMFRSLDAETTVTEHWLETAWTPKYNVKSHVLEIRSNTAPMNCPVIVNVHGGGWSLDHTERDTYLCRRLANALNCLVVDIDYVLAPEYPYPAALEEIEAVMDQLPELLKQWGGNVHRIVLCGQSAGGNLVAGITHRKRFHPIPGILGQILCYLPADNYNDHFHGEELDERGKSTEYYGFFYNRIFEERKNSDVSLVYANECDLMNLPSTDFVIAGIDNLVEESYRYYELLKAHQIPVTYRLFEKSRHGFLVNLYDEWKEGEEYLVELLKKYFQG